MSIRKRAPLRITIEAFQNYRRKEIGIEGLSQGVGQAMSLLENDIPKPVRDAIEWADSEIETIRFTVGTKKQREEVGRLWRELEEVFSRHAPDDGSDDV